MSDLAEFQKRIGYQFNNLNLIRQALTHSSYANEKHMKKHSDNERLEFLGDAVLEIVSSEFLYINYPDKPEGELTKLRASIVCEPTLALCTEPLELGKYLYLGKGEEATGGRKRDSIVSDAFEALIGAIFLDGGVDAARSFILQFALNDIEKKRLFHDCKTVLQERVNMVKIGNLSYEIVGESGPDHDKNYEAVAKIDQQVIGRGSGHTKKAAEQQAAYNALKTLDNRS